jgi:transcriptional regulator with XRE-family HTH domain
VDWGRLLRTARQVAGLSLSELSAATGLSKGHLSKLESGHPTAANPSRATLAALARTLPSFRPLANTLEPTAPLSALAFVAPAPQSDGAREQPIRLGWRELEVTLALLVLEQSAAPQPITALLIARSVGRAPGDVRPVLDHLVAQGVLAQHAPLRPCAAPTYRRTPAFEERLGIMRVGDALVLAAALLAQAPAERRRAHPPHEE